MIHLKCTVVHYGNLHANSIKKPLSNYRPSNKLFRFFQFLIYVSSSEGYVKIFMEKLSILNTYFQNSCSKNVVYYRILVFQNL